MASFKQASLIFDIGTGNVRVAIAETNGNVICERRDNVNYTTDTEYPEALYFDPDKLWNQILNLSKQALQEISGVEIQAVSVSSQRQGIVLITEDGQSLAGLPNHDHRGRQWENQIQKKGRVYRKTGRYPTSLFSAMKLMGLKQKHPKLYNQTSKVMSISDWAQYMISGVEGYEHSQASETLLYDVENMDWSEDLCSVFDIDKQILPRLHHSGQILGKILPEWASDLNLSTDIPVIVGGADTQLAIESTQPLQGDIVVVSGTTTPVVKMVDRYVTDDRERTWTGRHIDTGTYVLEANAGVTGLNYQRLKEIFYPKEDYGLIEQELDNEPENSCIASLGSLLANETQPMTKGGFIFDVPVSHNLSRASFAKSVLWDIACSVKENFDVLNQVDGFQKDYIWGCGGGFRSKNLTQYLANLTGKKVLLRDHFAHATVAGAALVCTQSLHGQNIENATPDEFTPQAFTESAALYEKWKKTRCGLKQIL